MHLVPTTSDLMETQPQTALDQSRSGVGAACGQSRTVHIRSQTPNVSLYLGTLADTGRRPQGVGGLPGVEPGWGSNHSLRGSQGTDAFLDNL